MFASELKVFSRLIKKETICAITFETLAAMKTPRPSIAPVLASIDDLKSSMADVGVDVIEVVTPDTTLEQVGYGDKVTLHIITEFDNPLYVTFESQATLIKILGFDQKLQYEVKMSATSKW